MLLLTAIFSPTNRALAQSEGVAVVGSYVHINDAVDIQLNYFMFLERVQHPWTCYFTGNGGYVPLEGDALGLGWDPFTGPDVLTKAANPPYQYQIGMYLQADLASAYSAALNGCAAFEPLYYANSYKRVDLRSDGEILGAGPPTWIAVSAGFSTSTGAELVWGPQLEFFDAVHDFDQADPNYAISFCANCTAARYANLKYSRSDWNVFDLRQGLRQASTFYNSNGWGWREQGGYGFPRVPNRQGDSITAAFVPTSSSALDAGPPLQPSAMGKAGLNGPQVAFRWYNFRQTTFDHTQIKIGTVVLNAASADSSYNWDVGSLWPPTATNAEFFTVLAPPQSRTSPPETYTQVAVPPIIAQPQFNSDAQFQFNIYGFPCKTIDDKNIRVYASSNLISWNLLQALCLADGKGIFKDDQIGNLNSRFYRIRQGGLHSQTMGFTRLTVPGGKSALIANQLDRGDNSAAVLFGSSTLPARVTITKQNPADITSYDPTKLKWSNPNLKLLPGEAAWLTNSGPGSCVVRFVGDVREGSLLNSLPPSAPIISFMLPIPFSSYARYRTDGYSADPLGPGATVRRWDGNGFVDYYNDSRTNTWTPQSPPIQPGEGFSIITASSTPTNIPVRMEMAFSGLANPAYVDQLMVTSIRVSSGNVLVSFTSKAGQFYRLQYTDDRTLSSWLTAVDNVAGTGDITYATHAGGSGSKSRFYRILQLQ
jgi:hypothetical protein